MKKRTAALAFLLLAFILPPRVAEIDRFVTVDEPWWVISGANFYYALARREFENTSYDYHPAVTTMWVVTAGMLSYFPEYRAVSPRYFDVRKPTFENFMREQGKEARGLLRNSRLVQSAVLIFFALLSFFLLRALIDERAAFFALALAMNAPFFAGHSRLLNHEALLALFSLTCVLALQVYLEKERKGAYLLLSGATFGLAQLTKSSSVALLPLVGLMFLVTLRRKRRERAELLRAAKALSAWLAAAVFIYFLLWPLMWVAPLKALSGVYGNAFSYAFQGARVEVAGALPIKTLSMAERAAQAVSYVRQWVANSTPLSWAGLLAAAALFFFKEKEKLNPPRAVSAYLAAMAALVISLFSVSSGRDSAHYILASYVGLDAAAGIGLATLLIWLTEKRLEKRRALFLPLSFAALLILHSGEALARHPYYYTYKNPLTRAGGIHGYGEGLDLAAEYLAAKPGARDTDVIVYAGRGCFSYFYPGRTEHMKVGEKDETPFIEDLQKADYFVVYNIYQRAKPEGRDLIRFLQDTPPEHIVTLDGLEYARIYKVSDLPAEIYAALTRK